MARLKLLRFSLTAIKGFNKEKALFFINLIIFMSFFALTASVVSMFYENKIDHIDNQIIKEETNVLIYENQIEITPLILKNIESTFYDNFKLDDYLKLLELWNDDVDDGFIITKRHTVFKPYWRFEAAANYGLEQISQSMSDAILVANNVNDINEIEIFDKQLKKIDKEIREIVRLSEKIQNERTLEQRNKFSSKDISSLDAKEIYYDKFSPLNDRLIQILQDQINFLINFNIKFFSRKKIETEKITSELEKDLKRFSELESLTILIAFILQLIVFISVQYFEVSTETANAKRTKKK